jgi:quercetin dioxygenase-like cupin family protein
MPRGAVLHRRSSAEEPSEVEKKHFIGRVTSQRLGEGAVPAGVDVVAVLFEPGARTRPHVHPTDQVLYFISGRGFVAFPAEEDQEIDEGGVFVVPAGPGICGRPRPVRQVTCTQWPEALVD